MFINDNESYKSKSLQGTEGGGKKKKKRICITRESYCSNKMNCMPQVLKRKWVLFFSKLSVSLYSRTLRWSFCSSYSPYIVEQAIEYWESPNPFSTIAQHLMYPRNTHSSTPHHLSMSQTSWRRLYCKRKRDQEDKIFPDLRESCEQKLCFLECRPAVCRFYFT